MHLQPSYARRNLAQWPASILQLGAMNLRAPQFANSRAFQCVIAVSVGEISVQQHLQCVEEIASGLTAVPRSPLIIHSDHQQSSKDLF